LPRSTNGLALTLMEKGRTAEASSVGQRAIEIATQSQEKTYSLAAESLYQLGNFRLRARDSKQADIFWSRAEEMARREWTLTIPSSLTCSRARAPTACPREPRPKRKKSDQTRFRAVRILVGRLGGDPSPRRRGLECEGHERVECRPVAATRNLRWNRGGLEAAISPGSWC